MESLSEGDPGGAASVSRLHMVDLAGSERQARTGAAGQRLREAGEFSCHRFAATHCALCSTPCRMKHMHVWQEPGMMLSTYHCGVLQTPYPKILQSEHMHVQRGLGMLLSTCSFGVLQAS